MMKQPQEREREKGRVGGRDGGRKGGREREVPLPSGRNKLRGNNVEMGWEKRWGEVRKGMEARTEITSGRASSTEHL